MGFLKREWRSLAVIAGLFIVFFYLPIDLLRGSARIADAFWESLYLVRWYAREHVLLCLIPAFFIAGAIAVFVSRDSVIKYLGAGAGKVLSYGVASVSGSILAVCSCTVLPLFAGIYKRGAGLGPAVAFLYSGPAINVLAIILTARVLGPELGIARAIGAVLFSILIGVLMHLLFRGEERERAEVPLDIPGSGIRRPLWQNALFFATLVAILVFANWSEPSSSHGFWNFIYSAKWVITGLFGLALSMILIRWFGAKWHHVIIAAVPALLLSILVPSRPMIAFTAGVLGLSVMAGRDRGELGEWFGSSWGFARQILPLLLLGVLLAGALLGRPSHEGLIPSGWIARAVGGNSIASNFFASIAGALMYFATLTEVPILQGLIGAGMGKGPALALLLAGPALSLPNMLVIRSVIGTRKTIAYVILVVLMATVTGLIYGTLF
jgi:uncharacterized membrane protein YraQ (UPF0718 family)